MTGANSHSLTLRTPGVQAYSGLSDVDVSVFLRRLAQATLAGDPLFVPASLDADGLPHPVMVSRIRGVGEQDFAIFTSAGEVADAVAALGPDVVVDRAGGFLHPTDAAVMCIPLNGGAYHALIDTEDYPLVSGYTWLRTSGGYAWAVYLFGESNHHVAMHRIVMMAPERTVVDHIDPAATLDNRKACLRICEHRDNVRNSRRPKHNTSGIKGVGRLGNSWQGYVVSDGILYRKQSSSLQTVLDWMVSRRRDLHGQYARNDAAPEMLPLLMAAEQRVGEESHA